MNATDFATKVAATFGVQPTRHGREYRVPCAVHEADGGVHNPSMAVWDTSTDRYAFKCMTGCSQESLREALRERGISIGSRGRAPSTEQQLLSARQREGQRVEQLIKARDCVRKSHPILFASLADRYLASRGIDLGTNPDERETFLGDYLCEGEDPNILDGWAMFGLICDPLTLRGPRTTALGITSLSLNDDGSPRLTPEGKKFRSIVGRSKGAGVPLGRPSKRVVVGEGIETTLAAMTLLRLTFGIATLSASNMPELAIPPFVTHVHVATDNDEAGLTAARRVAATCREVGLNVAHHEWGDKMNMNGWDAADELLARKGKQDAVVV